MKPAQDHARPFTGRHMAIILTGFFAIVFAVNFTMARYAVETFSGTVVDNSYVASQQFNRWLDRARAERALGWRAVALPGVGPVDLSVVDAAGRPLVGADIDAVARHPLGLLPDATLHFAEIGPGRYRSTAALAATRWRIAVAIVHAGRSAHLVIDRR